MPFLWQIMTSYLTTRSSNANIDADNDRTTDAEGKQGANSNPASNARQAAGKRARVHAQASCSAKQWKDVSFGPFTLIALFASTESFGLLAAVCKSWQALRNRDCIWSMRYCTMYPLTTPLSNERRMGLATQLAAERMKFSAVDLMVDWKAALKARVEWTKPVTGAGALGEYLYTRQDLHEYGHIAIVDKFVRDFRDRANAELVTLKMRRRAPRGLNGLEDSLRVISFEEHSLRCGSFDTHVRVRAEVVLFSKYGFAIEFDMALNGVNNNSGWGQVDVRFRLGRNTFFKFEGSAGESWTFDHSNAQIFLLLLGFDRDAVDPRTLKDFLFCLDEHHVLHVALEDDAYDEDEFESMFA